MARRLVIGLEIVTVLIWGKSSVAAVVLGCRKCYTQSWYDHLSVQLLLWWSNNICCCWDTVISIVVLHWVAMILLVIICLLFLLWDDVCSFRLRRYSLFFLCGGIIGGCYGIVAGLVMGWCRRSLWWSDIFMGWHCCMDVIVILWYW